MTPKTTPPATPNMNTIKTAFINPPIPIRSSDWAAWIDGREEDTTHTASTEREAIEAVTEQLADEGLIPSDLPYCMECGIFHATDDTCGPAGGYTSGEEWKK